jgi:hypothetical protein
MDWPPVVGRETPWQGKLSPLASRGSLGAVPAMGEGEEMNMWELTLLRRKVATRRKLLMSDILAVTQRFGIVVVLVVGGTRSF